MEPGEHRAFRCRRCGSCCRWPGYVLLTAADIARMAGHLVMPETEFIERYTRLAANRGQLALQDGEGDDCIFLAPAARCRVYPVRPVQCRLFPGTWDVPGDCPGRDGTGAERLEPGGRSC